MQKHRYISIKMEKLTRFRSLLRANASNVSIIKSNYFHGLLFLYLFQIFVVFLIKNHVV